MCTSVVKSGIVALIDVPLIGEADDLAVAAIAIGTAIASALASLQT
jgi:hypothetical protein